MRARLNSFAVVAACAVSVAALASACGSDSADSVRAVPTFPGAPRAAAAAPKARDSLLPRDCTEVLSGVGMSALLGQPVDGVQTKAIVGVGSPSVGMVERVSCFYRLSRDRGRPTDPAVDLRLQAYSSAEAATQHATININAERAAARAAEDVAIGSAPGVLFREPRQSVLIVTDGPSALALTMRDGVVADDQIRSVMLDLAQRVLPNVEPQPTLEPR